jgi:anti-anti-sigma factor
MPVSYDPLIVFVSLVVAIVASAGALFAMSRSTVGPRQLLISAPLIGLGIVSMHYIGMEAMEMPATIVYNPFLVLLSVLIAIGASAVALWLAFQFRADRPTTGRWIQLKFASAMVMGLAISGMHYVGMSAASFEAMPMPTHNTGMIATLPLAITIVGATCIILGFTLLSALFDRRFAAQSLALAENAQRYQSLFQHHSDAVLQYDLQGSLHDANQAAVRIFGRELSELRDAGLKPILTSSDAVLIDSHMHAAQQGEAQTYELAFAGENGCAKLVNMRNVPIVTDQGIVGVYMIATDITERAHAVEALRSNEGELRALVERQQALLNTIQELSTPVLPVHDKVLLLPLIGHLDSNRSQQLIEVLLSSVERHRATSVIIDITGVPIIDTAVAHHLIQATNAARLLGAETILVGIAPEVAQTIVQLGVDLGAFITRSNLQSGIEYAIARQSRRLVATKSAMR